MTVLLALTGAISYGLSDFFGGLTSRRTSPWAVGLVASLTGGVLILTAALVLGGEPSARDYWWGVAGGVGNGFGTAFLYRGLSGGRMGVVAPLSGVGAALLPVAVGVASGERPGILVWAGIMAALPGIWLVAREPVTGLDRPGPENHPPENHLRAVLDGALAGLGFGTLIAALGQIPDRAGLMPLVANQVIAAIAIVAIAMVMGQPWVPRQPRTLVGVLCGTLGATATVSVLLATQSGDLAVTAILTSLYPAVTIVLAASVLSERIHHSQGVGLVLCLVAVALVAGSS